MTETEEKLERKLIDKKAEIVSLKKELEKYKKGYHILLCYFDSISDEQQPEVSKKLARLDL